MTDRLQRHSIDLGRDEQLVTTVEVGSDPFVVSIRGAYRVADHGDFIVPLVRCSQCGEIKSMPTIGDASVPEIAERLRQYGVAVSTQAVYRHVALHESDLAADADPFHGLTEGDQT